MLLIRLPRIQLLQTIKGHHMSLVVLSWQMTWLESKSTTDERGASKESRNIAPAHRIEWENLMKISSHQFRDNNNYRTKDYSSLTLKRASVTITLLHHEKGTSLFTSLRVISHYHKERNLFFLYSSFAFISFAFTILLKCVQNVWECSLNE